MIYVRTSLVFVVGLPAMPQPQLFLLCLSSLSSGAITSARLICTAVVALFVA